MSYLWVDARRDLYVMSIHPACRSFPSTTEACVFLRSIAGQWKTLEQKSVSRTTVFGPEKKCLFQLLVYVKTLEEVSSAREVVSDIDDTTHGEIRADEITFLVEDMACAPCKTGDNVFRLASGEEFALSRLCANRPKPMGYEHLFLGKTLQGRRFTIVQPDRFVFASCDTKEDLRKIARAVTLHL